VRALVDAMGGAWAVDLETEEAEPLGKVRLDVPPAPRVALPRVVAAAASGSTVIAIVDRRPPLMVSHDAGTTWHEAGAGLPPGRALAIAADDPDLVLYATSDRLHVSHDGGRFWRALVPELPEIRAVAWESDPG
jgi:photosystem II stability/assembly factor-like uncharacterized protein